CAFIGRDGTHEKAAEQIIERGTERVITTDAGHEFLLQELWLLAVAFTAVLFRMWVRFGPFQHGFGILQVPPMQRRWGSLRSFQEPPPHENAGCVKRPAPLDWGASNNK